MEMPEMRHLARHPRQMRGGGEGQQQDGGNEQLSQHISTIARMPIDRYEANHLAQVIHK
jgi:hypothetical protein